MPFHCFKLLRIASVHHHHIESLDAHVCAWVFPRHGHNPLCVLLSFTWSSFCFKCKSTLLHHDETSNTFASRREPRWTVLVGGERPRGGYLLAADVVATVEGTGEVVLDTRRARRQLIFTFGRSQGPIPRGVTEGVGGMRQGGKRVMVVPPELGFGAEGRGPGVGWQRGEG